MAGEEHGDDSDLNHYICSITCLDPSSVRPTHSLPQIEVDQVYISLTETVAEWLLQICESIG